MAIVYIVRNCWKWQQCATWSEGYPNIKIYPKVAWVNHLLSWSVAEDGRSPESKLSLFRYNLLNSTSEVGWKCDQLKKVWTSSRSGYKIGRFVNIDRFVYHGRSLSENNTSSLGDDLSGSEIFSQILIGFPQMFVCISLVRKMNFLWLQSIAVRKKYYNAKLGKPSF